MPSHYSSIDASTIKKDEELEIQRVRNGRGGKV